MNSVRDPLKINHSHINAFSKKKKKKNIDADVISPIQTLTK